LEYAPAADETIRRRAVPETVQDFFENTLPNIEPSKVAGMTNTYAFDVDGAGQWTVAIADGKVTVADGLAEADCTISASEETLMKIAQGEQNATTAYMTGKLKIKGDMGAALKLQKLF
jgi:putative sterol carrier protein